VSESDGIDEVVAGAVRVAVQAAAWRVEASARRRQSEALTAVRGSTDQYTRWVAQQQTGRDAAGTELRHTVDEPGWWDTATPDQVGRAWETAQTWRNVHDGGDVDRQARLIEREAAQRWGVDPVRASAGLDAAARVQQTGPVPVTAEERTGAAIDKVFRRELGRNWATRTDLPESLTLETSHEAFSAYGPKEFDLARRWAQKVEAAQVRDPVAEGRDVPRAGEPWQEAHEQKRRDRVDLATAGPGVARPGERAHIPSIAELIRSRPDALRTAAAGRGLSEREAAAAAVGGAHQVRPAKAAAVTLTKPNTRKAYKPRTAVRATHRDTGRDGR
jgi:hypothetical protein